MNAVIDRLEDFFLAKEVRYEMISHGPSYSAQRTAQAEHVPGREEIKVVMVKADGRNVMVVLPATHQVDFLKLKSVLDAGDLRLAEESEFASLFPDCEVGAMPPFGSLYSVPVYADRLLAEDDHIVFNGGTHREAFMISYRDYEKLEHPQVADFARRAH